MGKRLYHNLRDYTTVFMSDGTMQAANTARSLTLVKNYLILDINVFIFMCICLYASNINFCYSNFLSFASVPVPHRAGAGVALYKQQHPRGEIVSKRPNSHPVPACPRTTGLGWCVCHPRCQPGSDVKYWDGCLWVQRGQHPMQIGHAKRCKSPSRHTHKEVSCKQLIPMRAKLREHPDPSKDPRP